MKKKALFLLTCSCILALAGLLPRAPLFAQEAGSLTGNTEYTQLIKAGVM